MPIANWLKRRFGPPESRPPIARPRTRLGCEVLEAREVPATFVWNPTISSDAGNVNNWLVGGSVPGAVPGSSDIVQITAGCSNAGMGVPSGMTAWGSLNIVEGYSGTITTNAGLTIGTAGTNQITGDFLLGGNLTIGGTINLFGSSFTSTGGEFDLIFASGSTTQLRAPTGGGWSLIDCNSAVPFNYGAMTINVGTIWYMNSSSSASFFNYGTLGGAGGSYVDNNGGITQATRDKHNLVNGAGGYITLTDNFTVAAGLVNAGSIAVGSGDTLDITGKVTYAAYPSGAPSLLALLSTGGSSVGITEGTIDVKAGDAYFYNSSLNIYGLSFFATSYLSGTSGGNLYIDGSTANLTFASDYAIGSHELIVTGKLDMRHSAEMSATWNWRYSAGTSATKYVDNVLCNTFDGHSYDSDGAKLSLSAYDGYPAGTIPTTTLKMIDTTAGGWIGNWGFKTYLLGDFTYSWAADAGSGYDLSLTYTHTDGGGGEGGGD